MTKKSGSFLRTKVGQLKVQPDYLCNLSSRQKESKKSVSKYAKPGSGRLDQRNQVQKLLRLATTGTVQPEHSSGGEGREEVVETLRS